MEPYVVEGALTLDASLGDDGLIRLRMGGNLSEDNMAVISEWAEKVRQAMREAKTHNPNRVLTLIEVLGSVEADFSSINVLHELMRHNREYATRTAVFGAEFFARGIIDMAIHATGRTNMRQFETRDEALAWLLENPAQDTQ